MPNELIRAQRRAHSVSRHADLAGDLFDRQTLRLIDRPSDRDSRRISAQSFTFNTRFLPGSTTSKGSRIHSDRGGPAAAVNIRASMEGEYSGVADK